jgi:uncharacterized membrane protein YeaQ/YmgE (transglycosylase-associated protein family)
MFDGLLMYLVGGAVIGILARFFKPGADPVGWIMTIVLGALGAVGGSYIAGMLGVTGWLVWVIAILVAIVLLFAWEAIRGRRNPRTA